MSPLEAAAIDFIKEYDRWWVDDQPDGIWDAPLIEAFAVLDALATAAQKNEGATTLATPSSTT